MSFEPPIYDSDSGHYISAEHQRIAELINDYDPDLFLIWIPPSNRNGEIYPFAILHRPVGKKEYIVRTLKEDEVDARLLAWLWANDQERSNPVAMVDKWDQARAALEAKKRDDELAELREMATSILKSPKSIYRINGCDFR
jgi:hypothetical protein